MIAMRALLLLALGCLTSIVSLARPVSYTGGWTVIEESDRQSSSALSSLETLIIDDHVDTCVQHALEAGETGERREKVTELVSILTGKKK